MNLEIATVKTHNEEEKGWTVIVQRLPWHHTSPSSPYYPCSFWSSSHPTTTLAQFCHHITTSEPPLLPNRDGEEVRRKVDEGAEMDRPRLVIERRKLKQRISYMCTESSTGGCRPPPFYVEQVPLAWLRQAMHAPGIAWSRAAALPLPAGQARHCTASASTAAATQWPAHRPRLPRAALMRLWWAGDQRHGAMEKIPTGDRQQSHPPGSNPPRRPRGKPAPPAIHRLRTTKKRKMCLCLRYCDVAGALARVESHGIRSREESWGGKRIRWGGDGAQGRTWAVLWPGASGEVQVASHARGNSLSGGIWWPGRPWRRWDQTCEHRGIEIRGEDPRKKLRVGGKRYASLTTHLWKHRFDRLVSLRLKPHAQKTINNALSEEKKI
jgi:hypothetical protein